MAYTELIKGCQKGKTSSQRELVRKFAGIYKAICLRYLPDAQAADDAVQESFINVFNNIQKYRGDGSFEGWMKRIAVNTSLNYRKKHFKSATQYVEIVKDDHDVQEVPDAYAHMRAEELLVLIRKLPDQYYMVFNMYVIDGMNHNEIAERLNITSSTSRATLSRARVKLIDILKKEELYTTPYINQMNHGV